MWVRVDGRRVFVALLMLLIALCWLTLSIWSLSPFAPYLGHELMEDLSSSFSQEYVTLLLVFVVGWTLMIIAMMLPTSLPLILMFQQMIKSRSDRSRLVALLMAGYLSVWILFGAVAHLGDLLVHEIVHRTEWLEANDWIISALLFATAGVFQFTPLKYKCLEKCRSPFSFIVQHWRGRDEQWHSFLLGAHHGLFCLGCCWALMLLMFAVSAGNIAWMFLLGIVMATEKNMPWGRRLSAPLGIFLISFSIVLTISALK